MTATGAGYLTWAGLLDILGHAGRPVIHQPAHAPSPPKLPRKQHNAPGEPDEVPALSGVEAVSSW